jgi:hypothetical protein
MNKSVTARETKTFVNDFDYRISKLDQHAVETHWLTAQGGLHGNTGVNQYAEAMNSARVAVFLIDEDEKAI